MFTRRRILAWTGFLSFAPFLSTTLRGFAPTSSAPLFGLSPAVATQSPDRVLRLEASRGFQSLAWQYGDQSYRETRSDIMLDENELIEMHLINNTVHAIDVAFAGLPFSAVQLNSTSLLDSTGKSAKFALPADQSLVLKIHASDFSTATLTSERLGMTAQFKVRPCDHPHPLLG